MLSLLPHASLALSVVLFLQLNYSRALGGKDLKPYGLSAVPDVCQMQLGPEDR